MSERETCAICGYHGCPGHLYYGNDCSVTFKTDNTAVIRALEQRVAELEKALDNYRGQVDRYGNESASLALLGVGDE